MTGQSRQWSKSIEYLCEVSFCSKCLRSVQYIFNSRSKYARCPKCSYYNAITEFEFNVTEERYCDDESPLDAGSVIAIDLTQ